MHIYVTVDAFIFFDTEPFDLWECWTIPPLATNLASHWEFLAALLNTDKTGRSLGVIIATFMLLLQTVCACICTSVCVVLFTHFNIAERADLNCFGASRGAGQEGKLEYGKKPPLLVKRQPVFLLCSRRLIAKANVLQTSKMWPKPYCNQGGFFTAFGLGTVS